MMLSIFLAKMMGIYILIGSLAALFNRDSFRKAAKEIYKNYAFLMTIAALELLGGLALVLQHNYWYGWQSLITLIGWLMVAEGTFFLARPESYRGIRKSIMKKNVYYTLCVIMALLGAFLTYQGFSA